MESAGHEVRTIRDYARVVRRRRWLILSIAVLVPMAALLYSLSRSPLYRASAEVLINRTTFVPDVTGAQGTFNQQPDRVAKTEASVAEVPAVAERVLKAAGVTDLTIQEFLAHSSATAKPDADLLVLSVEAGDPERAALLATTFAREFTDYRKELDTAAIRRAREGIDDQLEELSPPTRSERALYAELQTKTQQLQTAEALATGNTSVIREPSAAGATKIRPRPVRDVLLAAAIGLILGTVIAFLRDALDTRIRSADEIAERLGAPLLARIPEPPRRAQPGGGLVMLADPNGRDSESFRMLRTNLDFVTLERKARTIMITSASEREGKSTTVANLAVALARGGKKVVLVDLDLRRPFLDTLFGLEGRPGVTNVVLEEATVDDALAQVWAPESNGDDSPAPQEVDAPSPTRQRKSASTRETPPAPQEVEASSSTRRKSASTRETNGRAPLAGVLQVMTSGPRPPNPGEFVATRAVGKLVAELRKRADLILIDAPPLIGIGDAMTISSMVDGTVAVTRINVLTRPQAAELHRLLETSPATTLGFVITGPEEDEYHYAYGVDGYHTPSAQGERRERLAARPVARPRPRKRQRRRRAPRGGS
jgi:polysaccharide biosynthesis transport protein